MSSQEGQRVTGLHHIQPVGRIMDAGIYPARSVPIAHLTNGMLSLPRGSSHRCLLGSTGEEAVSQPGETAMVGKIGSQDGDPFVEFDLTHRMQIVRLEQERGRRLLPHGPSVTCLPQPTQR